MKVVDVFLRIFSAVVGLVVAATGFTSLINGTNLLNGAVILIDFISKAATEFWIIVYPN